MRKWVSEGESAGSRQAATSMRPIEHFLFQDASQGSTSVMVEPMIDRHWYRKMWIGSISVSRACASRLRNGIITISTCCTGAGASGCLPATPARIPPVFTVPAPVGPLPTVAAATQGDGELTSGTNAIDCKFDNERILQPAKLRVGESAGSDDEPGSEQERLRRRRARVDLSYRLTETLDLSGSMTCSQAPLWQENRANVRLQQRS